jgi:hypothetical protein
MLSCRSLLLSAVSPLGPAAMVFSDGIWYDPADQVLSPDTSGASRGFTAAGGPGLPAPLDVTGPLA